MFFYCLRTAIILHNNISEIQIYDLTCTVYLSTILNGPYYPPRTRLVVRCQALDGEAGGMVRSLSSLTI
jgi:hypothetical protein